MLVKPTQPVELQRPLYSSLKRPKTSMRKR